MKEFYLKDISKISIGMPLSRIKEKQIEPIKNVKFLSPKAIGNNNLRDEEIEQIAVENDIYEKSQKTKKGDILIKTTYPFDSVLIDEEHIGIMYNSFCINITVDRKIFNEEYIYVFLNTKFIRNMFESKAKAYRTTPISKKDLEKIKVPYLDMKKQVMIAEMYLNTIEREKTYKKLIEKEKQIIETIILKGVQ